MPLLLVANVTQVAALDDRLGRVTVATLAGSVVYLAGVVMLAALGLSVGAVVAAFAVGSVVPLVALVWPLRVIRPRWSGGGVTGTPAAAVAHGEPRGDVGAGPLAHRRPAVKVTLGFAELGRYERGDVGRRDRAGPRDVGPLGVLPAPRVGGTPLRRCTPRSPGWCAPGWPLAPCSRSSWASPPGPLLVLLYGDGFRSAGTALAVLVPG